MYITNELTTFALAIFYGFGIGVIFDFFRILRKAIKHKDIFVFIQDILLCLSVGVYIFFVVYSLNLGEFRLYILLGIILSNVIYFVLISKKIMSIFVCVLTFFQNIVKKSTENFK